jgi:DNA-binding MurR/RpiR family transcriptional regulator
VSIDVFDKIKLFYPKMSKGHKKIADYILENYDKASVMTALKLGQSAGVSESTVVRFATELSYDGYPELQQAINEAMRIKLTSVQRIEVSNMRMENKNVLEEVLNSDIERIRKTLEQSSEEQFNMAVEKISSARTVYIIGSRSAEPLAQFLSYYMSLMCDDVRLLITRGTSELLQQLIYINERDTVIGISFPRYSVQTINALKYASNEGAGVIAITDSEVSPIAEFADCTLFAKSDMISFADSLVAPLSLINALIVALSFKKQDIVNSIFKRLEDIWDKYDAYKKSENGEKNEL